MEHYLTYEPTTNIYTLWLGEHIQIDITEDNLKNARALSYQDLDKQTYDNRKERETTYTDAPRQYDGFGTRTVKIHGENVREVTTPKEHVEWQRARYGSGMYLSATPEQYAKLHKPR